MSSSLSLLKSPAHAHSAIKYTDIDYMIFTDAARFVSRGSSPYARDTVDLTPRVVDRSLGPQFLVLLRQDVIRCRRLGGWMAHHASSAAAAWNGPDSGPDESWSSHFCGPLLNGIFPLPVIWWLDTELEPAPRDESDESSGKTAVSGFVDRISDFLTRSRALGLTALSTFSDLNLSMYMLYGLPFMQHTCLYHFTRVDHRHNFSPYNILLYLSAVGDASDPELRRAILSCGLVNLRRKLDAFEADQLVELFKFAAKRVALDSLFEWSLSAIGYLAPLRASLELTFGERTNTERTVKSPGTDMHSLAELLVVQDSIKERKHHP
ncbi:hypothetical protein Egran_00959 [Elaphomyces granulatus]|uniref:GPI mannosyltransferase 1 n=1 Tax=Elaphomyces granulatus TaxID=519963 RepID=A0A232M4D3_9EURO|nr:hypothetical protein Egran_00959 [Elaphomyces granulatus]